jgi:sec-independent protein translocase protein TatA
MGAFSIWHLLIVLLVILVVFGAGRLPSVMGDMAKGVKAFKKGMSEEEQAAAAPPAAQVQAQPANQPTKDEKVANHS